MSEAFRCDGCDRFFGGSPAAVVDLPRAPDRVNEVELRHGAGYNDAYPAEKPKLLVEWPYVGTTGVEFCVECAADELVPAVADLAERGRYGDA